VQRAHAPNAGRWGLPGGVLELGETVGEGAMRELREETGVVATPAGVLTVLDALDRDGDGRPRHHYVLVVVRGDWVEGEGVAGDDAAAIAWLTREEILARDLPVLPALLPLVDRALNGSGGGTSGPAAFGKSGD
jgi:8-oxo-dGTP diphosphatase